jgi:hypothetical protein
VYGIVKQGRGSIWVHSEPGKGSTFKIYLPVATGAAEQPPAPADVRALHGSETVLVVEDQPDVRPEPTGTALAVAWRVKPSAQADQRPR